MMAPRWCRALLRIVTPSDRRPEVIGDLNEAHNLRRRRSGAVRAYLGTAFEALDMSRAVLVERVRSAPFSLLDFKLGIRMLARYPGLTVLGGIAMVFGLTVAATGFEMASQLIYPRLPLPEGDRIVGLEMWDAEQAGNDDPRLAFDFLQWQDRLTTVEHLGVFRTAGVNLRLEDGDVALALIAEMSASGFAVAGVQPMLGRTYTEADRNGPPVVVIGYDLWDTRFERDTEVVGKTLEIGRETATIIGVMPEGFGFPIVHRAWVPFRTDLAAFGPREGPAMAVFGKLVPGVSLEAAQTELSGIRAAIALESPETHENLRAQVLPHANSVLGIGGVVRSMVAKASFYGSNLTGILFVILICGNTALLVFARTVAREGELVVRGALGASRTRIVAQLFTEALALSLASAVVALGVVAYAVRGIYGLVEQELAAESAGVPFWFHSDLSTSTVFYTVLLAVVAATVAGVLPGLKVTRGLRDKLQQLTGGAGGFRFGGVWTAVIVMQIGVTVVAPFVTLNLVEEIRQVAQDDLDHSFTNHVTTQLHFGGGELPQLGATQPAAPAVLAEEFREHLLSDPAIDAVTFSQSVPRMYHRWAQVEVDGPSAEPKWEIGHRIGTTTIDLHFFETLGAEALQGRTFDSGDLDSDVPTIIVNESFVQDVLGGRNAIGQNIRFTAAEGGRFEDEPGPWMQIVGVVPDLGARSGYGPAGIYQPMRLGELDPVNVIIRSSSAASVGGRLPRFAFDVDPTLRVRETLLLEDVRETELAYYRFGLGGVIVGSLLAILLSTGGIYAIMAFTVSQRTREIGVRTALGSHPGRVVAEVLRRPLTQVGLGLAIGMVLVGVLAYLLPDRYRSPQAIAGIGLYMLVMTLVCLIGCVVPTRRALAVQPSEALRAEG